MLHRSVAAVSCLIANWMYDTEWETGISRNAEDFEEDVNITRRGYAENVTNSSQRLATLIAIVSRTGVDL